MTETIKAGAGIASRFEQAIGGQAAILACLYTALFFIVLLDLWSGVRKARRRGEFRSSYGLRKTVEKMARYFNMMLVLTLIDIMQMLAVGHLNPQISFHIPLFPVMTFLGALFAGIIEFKSICEKAEDKEKGKYREAAGLIRRIADDPKAGAMVSRLFEYLRNDNKYKSNE